MHACGTVGVVSMRTAAKMKYIAFLLVLLCAPRIVASALDDEIILHVSTMHASGATSTEPADGTVSKPFRSVPDALRAARVMRASSSRPHPITVQLGAGTFPPFSIGAVDSGTHAEAPTTIRGALSADGSLQTTISGGVSVPGALFSESVVGAWSIAIDGLFPNTAGNITLRGSPKAQFRVRTVLSGSPADPRHGLCSRTFQISTQNVLEQSDGADWELVQALDCGNSMQNITSSTFSAAYTADLSKVGISATDLGTVVSGNCVHGCQDDMPAGLSMGGKALVAARWPNYDHTVERNVYAHALDAGGTPAGALQVALGGGGASPGPGAARVHAWTDQNNAHNRNGGGGGSSGGAWLHGYFEWDWADCYRQIDSANTSAVPTQGDASVAIALLRFSAADVAPKPNARFYVSHALSELDAAREFFIETTTDSTGPFLHLVPPADMGPPSTWTTAEVPVVGTKTGGVVDISNSSNVVLADLAVMDGRAVGVLAHNVTNVTVRHVSAHLHGQRGIDLFDATSSTIDGCDVRDTGCAAIRAHGGDGEALRPGYLQVRGNRATRFARFKRTYEAGIHWSGVGNVYANNELSNGPHNCMLGGGNEADSRTLAGVDCLFENNTLDTCAYEAADTGAFYVCGQAGTAFVNRNNTIRDGAFRNIRNTVGTGVQAASVQAIYLDDQMSGWRIEGNSFDNCQVGSFIGGGRRNIVVGNRYVRCDTAQHIDNRGMSWQKGSCDCDVEARPLGPSQCDTGSALWMLSNASAAVQWRERFPEMLTVGMDRRCQPAYNAVENNTYCACGKFVDASAQDTASWGTSVQSNNEDSNC